MTEPRIPLTEKEGLVKSEVMELCGFKSESAFDHEVAAGRLPKPMPFKSREKIWYRPAVQASMAKLSTGATDDIMAHLDGLSQSPQSPRA